MKIAYLITLPELGGAQSHVRHLLASIDRSQDEALLMTSGEGWLTAEAEGLGVRTYPLEHLKRNISPWHDLRALVEILGVLRRERPDVLHIHSSKAGILGRLAGRLAGVPRVVFTAHGFSFHERLKPATLQGYVWLEKTLAPMADVIIPVSNYDRQRALAFGVGEPGRLVTIHNGIDTGRFRPDPVKRAAKRRELGFEGDEVLVGMVARFAFPKDHELLLLATQALLEREQARLVLIGSGPEFPRIQLLAHELGIAERVLFLGDRLDVPELLGALDVFVLASRFEALPMTIIEAMAAGLPVVASDVGGSKELVETGKSGLLVPSGDVEGMRGAIERLVQDPVMRRELGEAACRRAHERFDLAQMARRVRELYRP